MERKIFTVDDLKENKNFYEGILGFKTEEKKQIDGSNSLCVNLYSVQLILLDRHTMKGAIAEARYDEINPNIEVAIENINDLKQKFPPDKIIEQTDNYFIGVDCNGFQIKFTMIF